MKRSRGFTLAELMVVVGIMLLLMVATFGIFGVLSEQGGPDNATLTVQSMLNGARDYAASNGVTTQVYFYVDPNNIGDGTQMKLQFLPLGPSGQPLSTGWADVIGRQPVSLHNQMIVCRKMPDTLPAAPAVSTTQVLTEDALIPWKQYRASMLAAFTSWAMTSGTPSVLKTTDSQGNGLTQFGVVFDPSGYLAMNQNPSTTASTPPQASDPVYALTIIQIGGTKVTDYKVFTLNAVSGTPIVFE